MLAIGLILLSTAAVLCLILCNILNNDLRKLTQRVRLLENRRILDEMRGIDDVSN